MRHEDYHKMCEDVALGEWCIPVLADMFGTSADMDMIDRAVYKFTDCGAWCRFDGAGRLRIGTTVEGSDAEYSEVIPVNEDDTDETLRARVQAALHRCEEFAADHWEVRGERGGGA